MKYKKLFIIVPIIIFSLLVQEVDAQSQNNRFRSMFTKSNKCLDVVNDGTNNQLIMANCGNYSGQNWSIESVKNASQVKLRNMFTGNNKCLDIVNDGANNQLIMADCGNYSGQLWKVKPTKNKGFLISIRQDKLRLVVL